MKAGWMIVGALLVAAPLAAQQGAAEVVKKMTPEERALAQRKLTNQTSVLYDENLDPVKQELRTTMLTVRDTLMIVQTESSRLQRASSPTVATATARRLRLACQAASRSMVAAQPKVAGLRTSAKIGDDALAAYRSAMTTTAQSLQGCDKELQGLLERSGPPPMERLRAAAAAVEVASDRYEAAADGVLRTLEIPVRPKGVPGGL